MMRTSRWSRRPRAHVPRWISSPTSRSAATYFRTSSPTPFTDRRVVIPTVPLVLFASTSHSLVRGGASGLVRHSALAGYPLFVSDAAGEFHDLVHQFFRREGVDGPVIEASGSVEGVKKAVITDRRAIGLLPAYSVAEELRAATILRLNLRPAPPRMRLDALLSQSRARHPSAEELLVAIVQSPRASHSAGFK